MAKNPPANADVEAGSTLGGKVPWGGQGDPLQCSCLEAPKDRGAWWPTVYEAAELDRTEVT